MKKISFVVYYPYQWFIYKNIYALVDEDKREVIVDLTIHKEMQNEGLRENIITLLNAEGVNYRIIELVDSRLTEYVKVFFSNVEVLVSCWELGMISSIHVREIKKVNTTYGIAKEITLLRPTRSIYDLILAYGKRDQSYFSLLTKSVAIGNPRMDYYYTNGARELIYKKIKNFFIDQNKRILLYAPTHGDLSSLKQMFEVFSDLSKKYNIIFKPHYYTLREDKDSVDRYKKIPSLVMLDDAWDTVEVIACSDIVVSDNSSVIFDVMQVDKPIVLCDFLDKNFLDFTHKKIRFAKRGWVGASTYSGSLEQEIKDNKMVLTIRKPDELKEVLEKIYSLDENYKIFRKKIIQEHFECIDGTSSKKALNEIMGIYHGERKHVLGILYHAYLAYNKRTFRPLLSKIEDEDNENDITPKNSVIVWVYCDVDTNSDLILSTVYAALNQGIVAQVCVSGLDVDSLSKIFIDNSSRDKIFLFKDHSEGFDFIVKSSQGIDSIFFARPNTNVTNIENAVRVKALYGKDIIFFAENIYPTGQHPYYKLFNLFKYEVLRIEDTSKSNVTAVSYAQIHTIIKSGALIDLNVIMNNEQFKNEVSSCDRIFAYCILLESFKSSRFMLMPNFLLNFHYNEDVNHIYKKLIQRSLYLEMVGISQKKWPDNHMLRFIVKFLAGDTRYYYLLKLFLTKILLVKYYRVNIFLKKNIATKRKGV